MYVVQIDHNVDQERLYQLMLLHLLLNKGLHYHHNPIIQNKKIRSVQMKNFLL